MWYNQCWSACFGRGFSDEGLRDNVVGSTHLDMRGHKIVNLREPTARSDAVTKGFVESIFNTDLDMQSIR
jgi:hypothetical protein